MRQIALALYAYADGNQSKLPPVANYVAGKPLLSCRVHLLPYIEEQALYNEFPLDEPWDSPHNRELIKQMPAIYACPGQKTDKGKTCFLAPSGKKTLFPPQVADGIAFNDIADGAAHTILVVDANDENAVIWTKPEDFEYEPKQNPIPKLIGHHPGGFGIVLADGAWLFVPETVDLTKLRAYFTYNGGEVTAGGLN